MPTYDVSKSFNWQGTITDKVASVCRMFGLHMTFQKVSTGREQLPTRSLRFAGCSG